MELGRVAGRQGTTDQALRFFDEAEALAGPHPAISAARGQALSQVWRWEPATEAWRMASQAAPNDDWLLKGLAMAQGSQGNHALSLEAAQKGLSLEPRDPTLLRSQMLAYQSLLQTAPSTELARQTWAAHRRDDLAPAIKSLCSDRSGPCWLGRKPVPTYQLR